MQNPTLANGGCSAGVTLYRVVNGVVSQISSVTVPCATGTVYHAAAGNDGALHFWANNVEYLKYTDPQPLTGRPGVGGYGMPGGNGISLIQLGPCDRNAPSAIAASSVQNYALSTEVDLQTGGSADDANGIGIDAYLWYRDGIQVAATQAPAWSDVGVSPGTSHSYSVQAEDHHGNVSALTTIPITVPAAMARDARQVGIRPTGSYWGARGEQIDMRSGNLNFTYPLIEAMSRGWSLPIALIYNSQNWRLDNAGNTWKLGADVGFGFGWKMEAGSLTPFYSNYTTLQFYRFSDASGATYRLDQNNNGIWTSKESVYVTCDANRQRLYFNNGMFWVMGSISAGTEPDAGSMYPTLAQDSNGNRIQLEYRPGVGVSWINSSARLAKIYDVRPGINPPGNPTFLFTYNNDVTPHLVSVANAIGSKDSFGLSYAGPVTLAAPFGNAAAGAFGSAATLSSVLNNAVNLTTAFDYDAGNTGELTKVTFPYGGTLRWQYGDAAYTDTTLREVQGRYLQWDASIPERGFTLTGTMGGSASTPANRSVVDTHANAFKQWQFLQNPGVTLGYVGAFSEGAAATQTALRTTNYTWAQDPGGNPYIGRLQVVEDPGQSYAVTNQTDQTVDQYGNVTQTKLYDFTDLANPAKTFNTTYLTSANGTNYPALYLRNRVASVTLTDRNNVTTTLKQNSYDQYPAGIAATANIQMQDTADYGPGYFARGNVYGEATPSDSWHHNYDQTGRAVWTGQDVNPNHYVSQSTSTQTNFSAPELITTSNSLTTQMSWSNSLQRKGQTGANGESSTIQYDPSDRPSVQSSPYGAQTVYSYGVSGPQVTATTDGRWAKTYLDGLGRTARQERGDTAVTKSVVETVYDTCGCNPLGKVYQQSMPHLPGATPVWTVYTYDSLGRLLTRKKPDGQSTTTYSYAGQTVTITDPSGKWKKITRDSFGQIVRVEEPSPKPASEPNHVTLYTYDVFGHLTQVQMDRTIGGTVRTQNRAWTYDAQTLRLLSKTSPEAGTVTYTYNSDNTLATVTDAKNQRQVFTYDNFGRIVQIARGAVSGGTFAEDVSQRTTYTYEGTNNGFSTATNGRVSQVTYAGPHGTSFVEMYSYHNAGGVTKKRVQITGTPFGSSTVNMDAAYTYDGEGRVLSIRYPFAQVNGNGTTVDGPLYSYSYDSLGRLRSMTDQGNTAWVNDVTYGPADEMLSMTANGFTETRTYNANLQLTELVSGASVHRKYIYSATQNNGQIVSQQDLVSGETISYQYDSLKRLVQANAAGDPTGSWAQNFGYDGFGNLTDKTSTNAPQLNVAVDWATNRIQSFAGYDNNGNLTGYVGDGYSYDLQNRMIQASVSGAGTVIYGYDTTNHRTYKAGYSNGTYTAEEFYFYGVEGHKYGTWKIDPSSGVLLQASVTKQWFGGRLVSPEDRLGSKGKYFAFGEERTNITPANPPNDQEKFATYTRDAATGLDYANQRYYSSIIGRFTKPDPLADSALVGSPQTWNRYAYAGNDPANEFDPTGNCTASVTAGGVTTASYFDCGVSAAPSAQRYPSRQTLDPLPLSIQQEKATITYLKAAIDNDVETDCQALADYIQAVTEPLEGNPRAPSALRGALILLTPISNSRFAGPLQGSLGVIGAVGAPVLNAIPKPSGFRIEYQDSTGLVDQAHHFAAFFQLGFSRGAAVGADIAYYWETLFDKTPSNQGDVNLGTVASRLGAYVASGVLPASEVAATIREDLCNPKAF